MLGPAPFAGTSGRGQVVVVRTRAANARGHGAMTLEAMARRIAALLGHAYAGDHDPAGNHAGPLYFVPDDTLLLAGAARLGIRTEDSLFGGVVPYPFVATKSLSHPALEPTSAVPHGWSHGLAARFADAVLPGFSAEIDQARADRVGTRPFSTRPCSPSCRSRRRCGAAARTRW